MITKSRVESLLSGQNEQAKKVWSAFPAGTSPMLVADILRVLTGKGIHISRPSVERCLYILKDVGILSEKGGFWERVAVKTDKEPTEKVMTDVSKLMEGFEGSPKTAVELVQQLSAQLLEASCLADKVAALLKDEAEKAKETYELRDAIRKLIK